MATPQQYQNRATNEQLEDCRDYLRTGRCKYGNSCKYNHPSNVQSGGGMKAPVDSSEPLYPVRPNESPCQYYMKHGTCKFGQACKFHHPPQQQVTAVVGGNTVVMNVGSANNGGDNVTQHIILNSIGSVGGDAANKSGSQVTLQFLPQRPNEPDCIYFLRNGRCKYGATCRYHHPVSVQQQRRQVDQSGSNERAHQVQHHQGIPSADIRSRPGAVDYHAQSVPFLPHQSMPASYGQQGQRQSAGSQILVSDGQASFIPMNNSSNSSPMVTSSSVASHENSVSGFESLNDSWNRPKRSGSRDSLGAYATGVPRSGSFNAIQNVDSSGQLYTVDSCGQFYTQVMHAERGQVLATDAVQRSVSVGSMASLNGDVNQHQGIPRPTFQQVPSGSGHQLNGSAPNTFIENPDHYQDNRMYNPQRLPPQSKVLVPDAKNQSRKKRSSELADDDDGLSMMTSALLNMIDTPEETAVDLQHHEKATLVPQATVSSTRMDHYSGNLTGAEINAGYHPEEGDNYATHYQEPYARSQNVIQGADESDLGWSSAWNAQGVGGTMDQNAQSMSALQQHSNPPPSPAVGLYLS